jgi:hydroxymethylpyrimidine pyrophosphatase-like HAD family hydrolase
LFIDVYSNYHWFEINNINATKKNGIKFLKTYLNTENVSCFGDNLNDVSMFEECENSYAVENAHEDLKELADKIIGSNIDDGVAKFLESRLIL